MGRPRLVAGRYCCAVNTPLLFLGSLEIVDSEGHRIRLIKALRHRSRKARFRSLGQLYHLRANFRR
jgi:hypothetical protein